MLLVKPHQEATKYRNHFIALSEHLREGILVTRLCACTKELNSISCSSVVLHISPPNDHTCYKKQKNFSVEKMSYRCPGNFRLDGITVGFHMGSKLQVVHCVLMTTVHFLQWTHNRYFITGTVSSCSLCTHDHSTLSAMDTQQLLY